MNVFPVISREFRAQARQPFTYSLRTLGVLALLGGGAAFALRNSFSANMGGELFDYLRLTLLLAIWVLVPLSTADCISRERREGTLGLLFLTPLKPTDIVIAKGLAHGLRAITLLVAVLPVLTIPFLLGGVSWQQAAISALLNFSAICWMLSAALIASAGSRRALRALVSAVLLACLALWLFPTVTGILAHYSMLGRMGFHRSSLWESGVGYTVSTGFAPTSQVLWTVAQTFILSVLVLAIAVLLAAGRIRRSWREEPPPMWVQTWQKTFFTPVMWVGFFRKWMRWKLRRNPIGWLEQRTWQGRLVTWSWFAVIVSIYSAVLTDRMFFRNFSGIQVVLGWLMMGSIASSAAGSFRRERETGVLELLLVAPLTSRQIIGGRLRGLWGQFLPALVMLLGIWLYFDAIFRTHAAGRPVVFFGLTFVTLPIIGLYFSLRCRNFLTAFLLTLAFGLIGPMALERLVGFGLWAYGIRSSFFGVNVGPVSLASAAQAALAIFTGAMLRRRLETRSFPLERTVM